MSVHPLTETVREQFPLAYQDADDNTGQPLLRWLSLLWDQAGEISNLVDRIDVKTVSEGGAPGALSALIDPANADDAWLPWLGQLFGFDFPTTMPADAMRAAIATATFQRGTIATIEAAAARYLKPGGTATVLKVDEWDYDVHVHTSQIIGATYDELSLDYPTYTAFTAAFPTYADVTSQLSNLEAAVQAEKPAGFIATVEVDTTASYAELSEEFPTYTALAAAFPTYDLMTAYLP